MSAPHEIKVAKGDVRPALGLMQQSGGLIDGGGFGCSPSPRQQIIDALSRMGGNASQHVGKPGLRIDVVHLSRDDQAIHYRRALSASIRAAEQPRFAPEGDRANLTLMLAQAFEPEPAIVNPFAGLFHVKTVRDGRRDQR